MSTLPKPQRYAYHINLDERGEFNADVRNGAGKTVFEISDMDIFEDGWMKHKEDLTGLKDYLVDLGIMRAGDALEDGNCSPSLAGRPRPR